MTKALFCAYTVAGKARKYKRMQFGHFTGIITEIGDQWRYNGQEGCDKLMTVQDGNGNIVNFVVTPGTYFVDRETVKKGDTVTGYYDANAPAILIYPPQYPAVVMARVSQSQNVAVDHFDSRLVSSDGMLMLNVSPLTQIVLENDQTFTGSLKERDLIVIYGASTRSIPAQTTPYKIIVMCSRA